MSVYSPIEWQRGFANKSQELASLFSPHKVCSARILRDKNGMGRGVGFAR